MVEEGEQRRGKGERLFTGVLRHNLPLACYECSHTLSDKGGEKAVIGGGSRGLNDGIQPDREK